MDKRIEELLTRITKIESMLTEKEDDERTDVIVNVNNKWRIKG